MLFILLLMSLSRPRLWMYFLFYRFFSCVHHCCVYRFRCREWNDQKQQNIYVFNNIRISHIIRCEINIYITNQLFIGQTDGQWLMLRMISEEKYLAIRNFAIWFAFRITWTHFFQEINRYIFLKLFQVTVEWPNRLQILTKYFFDPSDLHKIQYRSNKSKDGRISMMIINDNNLFW